MLANKGRIALLLIVSLGLLVLFLVLPKQPASVLEPQEETVADSDSLRLQQAIELVNGPQPVAGIKILQQLVDEDSTNIEAQYWLGAFSVKSQQYEKAIARYNTVLRLDPNYLAAYVDLGGVYLEMDSAEKALYMFEKGVEIDSTNNYALLFAAQTQERLGLLKDAKKNYQQLLRHNADTIVTKRIEQFIANIDKKLKP